MSDLEEINAHRATLGLAPISADVDENGEEVEEAIDEDQQAYDNYQRQKEEREQAAKKKEILDRIEKSKNRKKQHEKLKGKGLADDDDEEGGALAWIRKSRQREKQLAEQRAKALADMDDEQQQQQQQYRASDLRGLKVGHDITDFEEGQETILTLKDRGILDDDEGSGGEMDELTNVNMEDRERLLKNLDNKKKKPGYNPYDDDEFLLGQDEKPSLLPHYDEDKKRSEGFVLGKQGSISTASVAATRQKHQANQPQLSVADKLKQVQTLDYDKTQGIKDYYTQDEINLTFKKPKKLKKKKKIRQRTTMPDDDDIQGSVAATGVNQQQEEEDEPKAPYQPAADANFVDDDDLQEALARSRRDANRQKKKLMKRMTPEDIARSIVEERTAQEGQQDAGNNESEADDANGGGLVLSETTEFLNSVGNVPIYVREQRQNMAANSVSPTPEDHDTDMEDTTSHAKKTTVTDIDEDQSTTPPPPETAIANVPVEEDEPVYDEPLVGRGLAATLNLLSQKGLMAKATPAQLARDKLVSEQLKWQAESRKREQQLKRQIDQRNKGTGERDRHREYDAEKQKEREERDRLREHERRMADYKPDVYLEYVDDQGHVLKTKEAFRYQSHKFHGKTSGKGKTEKRLQKLDEEKKLNMMSSTDTPLNLAGALLERQQRTGNAHVVLSVGNRGAVPSEGSGIKRSLDQNTQSPNKKR